MQLRICSSARPTLQVRAMHSYWAQPETVAAAVLGRFVLAACEAYHRQYCVREAYITQPNMSRAVDTPCTMLAAANSQALRCLCSGAFAS